MAGASYSTTTLLRSLVHRPQGVILVYLVVKLIYTGLVKYAIITYTNNVCLCQAAAGGKINSTHAASLMFVTHWPRHKRNAI